MCMQRGCSDIRYCIDVETKEAECHFFFRVPKSFQKVAAFSPRQTGSRGGNDLARGKQCIENGRSHFKETVFSCVKAEPKAL